MGLARAKEPGNYGSISGKPLELQNSARYSVSLHPVLLFDSLARVNAQLHLSSQLL